MNRAFSDAGRLDLDSLRREFDQSFAREPRGADVAEESLLSIRVGPNRFVLRGAEIDGVGVAGKVIRVPSRAHGLAGVTGIRGALVPVFSLATLLGEPPGEGAPGWLCFVGRDEPLAFAFHGIDGYRKVAPGTSSPLADAAQTHASLREIVSWDASVVPVIHMPSLVSLIRRGSAHEGTRKEGK